MKNLFRLGLAMLISGLVAGNLEAQESSGLRERVRQQTLNRFDENGDGKLSVDERKQAQAFLRERFTEKQENQRNPVEPQVNPRSTPLYKLASGPYRIARQDFELPRGDGELPLPVKITFPVSDPNSWQEAPPKMPVIVFSHGAGGSRDTYQPLTDYWASHGYIVLQPTHSDSLSLLSTREKQQIRLKSYVTDGGIAKYLIPRTEDVKLILDQFNAIQNGVPELKFEMDAKRIGMGGHSYGAYTTQLIDGLSLVNPLTKRRSVYADERPVAFLAISPQGIGGLIDDDAFAAMTRPLMVVTGSHDDGVIGQPAKWRLDAFSKPPSSTKYLTFIEGAVHNFGGISGVNYLGSGEPNSDHVYYVKSSTLAFWDSQLKSDSAASEYLDSGKLQDLTKWVARISRTVSVGPTKE